MPLNGIIWIIMSRNLSTLTLEAFLTIINLIYENLFNHQPLNGLSVIINAIKLFAKKRNIGLDNIVAMKKNLKF